MDNYSYILNFAKSKMQISIAGIKMERKDIKLNKWSKIKF